MKRPIVLTLDAPLRDLLKAADISIAELARRREVKPATVSNAIEQGRKVQLDKLAEAAELCGYELELRLREKG